MIENFSMSKRWLVSFTIVILMILLLITGCAGNREIYVPDFIQDPIKASYISYVEQGEATAQTEDISLEFLGMFWDACVFLPAETPYIYATGFYCDTIDDVNIVYVSSRRILVYSGGTVCTLPEAFASGILNKQELYSVQERYYAQSPDLVQYAQLYS